MRAIENFTSSAVKSEPSWNFTPRRSLNSHVVGSTAFQVSASRGSISSPSRDHAAGDDRAVLPIGSTEQHAHLSLSVDTILSERVATEAAEPLRIPVFPVIAYGLTPNFVEYPGTITLRMATMCALVTDVLDG